MEQKSISHYVLLSKIGEGGMGEVYLAEDKKLDRTVALKILPAEVASDPERLRRFVQEAKAASALDHPNVAHIYEIGEADGTNFIAMQYIEGQTLDAKSKDGPLKSKEILEIAVQAADALDAAASKGITHRDIKAANIMMTPRGQVKVLDFGLAKMESKTASEAEASRMDTTPGTTPGMILGTVQYMSPEQALGKLVDHRSDIYSLGVVLYQLATGRLPFSGSNPSEILNRILNSQPDAIARLNYNIDPELERIIRKCIEKDPQRRYQSSRELLIDLKNLKRDSESGSRPQTTRDASRARIRWIRFAPILGALAATVGIAYYLNSGRGSEIRSLAVLPFVNSNPDPANEWLSDGITETTINSLSQIPDLKVMARSTVNRFKGKGVDPQQTGRDLKVDAVLTGNVTQQGADLVIGAELVNVKDGSLIWGKNYRNSATDLAAVQQSISEEISDELRRKLTGEQMKEMTKQFSADPKAYELYLKGRFYWNKRSPEGLTKAIEHFQQAIETDPTFAAAYAGLADAYVVRTSPFSREIRLSRGKEAAEKALELDPNLAEAYVSLGATRELEWDWKGAVQLYRKAIQLNPNYPTAHQWLSEALTDLGRGEEALVESRRALELDPLSNAINASLGRNLYYARRYDEALDQFRKALELNPSSVFAHLGIADTFIAKKQYLEALQQYEEVCRMTGTLEQELPRIEAAREAYETHGEEGFWQKKLELDLHPLDGSNPSAFEIAADYSMLRDKDRAFQWLDKAIEVHDLELDELRVDPWFDPLHSDPRFLEYVHRLNLD